MRCLGLVLAMLLGLAPLSARAQETREDPLDLVALLVRDAQWDRASVALAEVSTDKQRPSWVVRYHTLQGLIAAAAEAWPEAATAFERALEVAEADPDLEPDPATVLHLAQALHRSGRSELAMERLRTAPESARALSALWLLLAQVASAVERPDVAWEALTEGSRRFPDLVNFPREVVLLYVRQGLYQEAAARAEVLLARPDATVEDVLLLAESLRRAGDLRRAGEVAAQGRLRFPDRVEAWKQSAAVAIAQGRLIQAARDLTVGAELDPSLAYEAAEVWRRAGDMAQAMRLNAAVPDPAKKAYQRVGLLLEQEAWDLVIALEERLKRLEVTDDDSVLYGLAYARFQRHDLEEAEAFLAEVDDPAVFKLATSLREAMENCRKDPGTCP